MELNVPRYAGYLILIFALSGVLSTIVRREAFPLGLCVALIAVCQVMISEGLQKRLDRLDQQSEAAGSKLKT